MCTRVHWGGVEVGMKYQRSCWGWKRFCSASGRGPKNSIIAVLALLPLSLVFRLYNRRNITWILQEDPTVCWWNAKRSVHTSSMVTMQSTLAFVPFFYASRSVYKQQNLNSACTSHLAIRDLSFCQSQDENVKLDVTLQLALNARRCRETDSGRARTLWSDNRHNWLHQQRVVWISVKKFFMFRGFIGQNVEDQQESTFQLSPPASSRTFSPFLSDK